MELQRKGLAESEGGEGEQIAKGSDSSARFVESGAASLTCSKPPDKPNQLNSLRLPIPGQSSAEWLSRKESLMNWLRKEIRHRRS